MRRKKDDLEKTGHGSKRSGVREEELVRKSIHDSQGYKGSSGGRERNAQKNLPA